MTDEDWKEFIKKEMEKSIDDVMAEIEADPKMKDVKPPEGMYDNVMAMIHEHERQKLYEQLPDEDKELIRLGRVYKKKRKFYQIVVVLAAVIIGLGIGSVCIGEGDGILSIVSTRFFGKDKTEINSDNVDPILYTEEEKAIEEIEHKYGFTPVKLEYLPKGIVFEEADFGTGLQGVNMFYMADDKVKIIYIIRPNYREGSLGTVVEDEKIQEYMMSVENVEITIIEYYIAESGENRWAVSFEYQNVQYLLRITDMEQQEIEKIIKDLCFM